jgi:flagellar FliL protein
MNKEGGHGEDGGEVHQGMTTPTGKGGDNYASNYYPLEKEFTSNLQDSVHFIQVGIAVSTPYDDRVLDNIKTHEIAIRSAILLALGETSEEQVFTAEGKKQIQARLAKAINAVLQEKEGFGGVSNVYFTNFIVQ